MAQRPCAREREEQLVALLTEFLDGADRGLPVDADGLAAAHPDVALELVRFVRAYEWLERLIAELPGRPGRV
jgi:hypothetical protein